MLKKGQALMGIAVAIAVTAIMVTVLWSIISQQTEGPYTVTNETINFATNDTYYSFATSGDNVLSVTSVGNNTFMLGTGSYSFDNVNDQIKIYTNTSLVTGNFYVTYTWRYNTYLTDTMNRQMMGYVFTFFILAMLVMAGAYVWTLKK